MSILLPNSTHDDKEEPLYNDAISSQNNQTYNFLLLGRDNAADLCDVIIIVSYDTQTHNIEAMQIPRDTYASYTSASYRKLNGAVHALGSAAKFSEFIESSLGIRIDYYVSVDLETIAETVDKLGGVEVAIAQDMVYNDPYQNLSINLSKGKHLLNGKQATQFIRYRAGYVRGDIGRLDAQKIFLASFVKKILKESDAYDLASIALSLLNKLDTNVSAADCLYFISQIGNIKMENIALMTMPGEDIQGDSGAWYYIINREEAFRVIQRYFSPSLTEEEFDRERAFTSIYRQGFNAIYEARGIYKTERYTAEDICRDGINIE
jgi:LCP family protein required for cell wall assembly